MADERTQVLVQERVWIRNCTSYIRAKLHQALDFTYSTREMREGELRWVQRVFPVVKEDPYYAVVPYGALPLVRDLLPDARYSFQTVWSQARSAQWYPCLLPEDRELQTECLQALYERFRAHQYANCLIAPCGAGKTNLGARLLSELQQRTCIVVHTKELQDQWVDRLRAAFPDLKVGLLGSGVKKADQFTDDCQVLVALVQSLHKKLDKYRSQFGVIIGDEIHHCPAETFATVFEQMNATVKLGLTASERRSDGLHPLIYAIMGSVANRIMQSDLNDAGVTMPPEIRWVQTGWTWQGDVQRDYTKMMTALVEDKGRNRLIVEEIKALMADDRRILVLSERVDHLRILKVWTEERVGDPNVQILTGEERKSVREIAMDRLVDGTAKCTFATKSLAKEGLDAPLLDAIVLATPFRSQNDAQQIAGRAQRSVAGKRTPIIVDFEDNVGTLMNQARDRRTKYRELMEGGRSSEQA